MSQIFFIVCVEIKKIYNMSDPILPKLYTLKPENALSLAFRDKEQTLVPLITLMPWIVSKDDWQHIQNIDDQWQLLSFLMI